MSSSSTDVLQLVKPGALATVLFCDMRGYTQFASEITAEQLVEILNSYLSIVVRAVEEHHGTVAKFVGDAVFAYWLAEDQPDHAALACRFAAELPGRLSAFPNGITTNIGIHTGNVAFVRFTRGSNHSPEPMGETVNLASRLHALCSQYQAMAIASEAVISSARNIPGWTAVDCVEVKGKTEPITLYGLLQSDTD